MGEKERERFFPKRKEEPTVHADKKVFGTTAAGVRNFRAESEKSLIL